MRSGKGGHDGRAGPRAAIAAAAITALAALGGCSSPVATLRCTAPDPVLADVRNLFLVVAPEKQVDPGALPAGASAMSLVTAVDVDRASAFVQLKPVRDPDGKLAWEVVDARFRPQEEPLVELEIDDAEWPDGRTARLVEDPFDVSIADELVESDPTTALLLVATFRSGAGRAEDSAYVGPAAIAAGLTRVLDLRELRFELLEAR